MSRNQVAGCVTMIAIASFLVLGSSAQGQSYEVPFSDGLEYAGAIDGEDTGHWQTTPDSGLSATVATDPHGGSRCLQIAEDEAVYNDRKQVQAKNVWVEMWSKIYPWPQGETAPTVSSGTHAMFILDQFGRFRYYDGTGWQPSADLETDEGISADVHGNAVAALTKESGKDYTGWTRVLVNLNYNNSTWALAVEGPAAGSIQVLEQQIPFSSAGGLAYYNRLEVQKNGFLDDINVTVTTPSEAVNGDTDGYNDLAEITYFGECTTARSPTTDSDGDGRTDDIELATGTNPNVADSKLEIVSGSSSVNNVLLNVELGYGKSADLYSSSSPSGPFSTLVQTINNNDPYATTAQATDLNAASGNTTAQKYYQVKSASPSYAAPEIYAMYKEKREASRMYTFALPVDYGDLSTSNLNSTAGTQLAVGLTEGSVSGDLLHVMRTDGSGLYDSYYVSGGVWKDEFDDPVNQVILRDAGLILQTKSGVTGPRVLVGKYRASDGTWGPLPTDGIHVVTGWNTLCWPWSTPGGPADWAAFNGGTAGTDWDTSDIIYYNPGTGFKKYYLTASGWRDSKGLAPSVNLELGKAFFYKHIGTGFYWKP